MDPGLIIALFWCGYGICGLRGRQWIKPSYRGYVWSKSYTRAQGLGWLIMGWPWLIWYALQAAVPEALGNGALLGFFVLSVLPSFIFIIFYEKKYRAIWEKEQAWGYKQDAESGKSV